MEKLPSLALPPRRDGGGGRFWGRGRFSERSASPPDPLSRRAAGVWGVTILWSWFRLSVGEVSDRLGLVTAADRAAATCQRWKRYKFISGGGRGRSESWQTASVHRLVSGGHVIVTCGGFAATHCLLPQKEGNHPQSGWWRIHPIPSQKAPRQITLPWRFFMLFTQVTRKLFYVTCITKRLISQDFQRLHQLAFQCNLMFLRSTAAPSLAFFVQRSGSTAYG